MENCNSRVTIALHPRHVQNNRLFAAFIEERQCASRGGAVSEMILLSVLKLALLRLRAGRQFGGLKHLA
jgi:hypothetical protein